MSAPIGHPTLAPRHILIIDDSPDDRANMRQMLLLSSERRWFFIEAELGEAGLRAFRAMGTKPPDCILLDYNLPDMNALQVLTELRAGSELPPCPVVVVTGADTQPGQTLLRSGAQDYISKSWTPSGLLRAVENAIERFAMLLENKRTHQRLYESEERYRLLFDRNPDGVLVLDTSGRFLVANPACETICGYPLAELLQKTLMELCAPDQQVKTLQHFQHRLREPAYAELETALLRKDGRRVELWLAQEPLLSSGQLTSWHCTAKDVTDRKRADEARTRLAAIVESTQDAIISKTLDGIITSWNSGAEHLFGYQADEIIGQHVFRLIPAELQSEEAIIIENLRHGQSVHFESVRLAKDGHRFPVALTISALRDKVGAIIGGSKIARDITERKRTEEALRESERNFRSLAEVVPQIVWATRPDGWNIYFNQRWVDYTGLTLEGSYGNGWATPFHPDDKQRASEAWHIATQQGTPYELECRLRRADGVYRWWLIRGEPMRGRNDEIVKWFGTCTDIEEMKQAEVALRKSEARLALALEGGQMGLWEWDMRTSQSVWNVQEYKLLGLPPGDGNPSTNLFFRHVHPEDTAGLDHSLKQAQAGLTDWRHEFRIIRHDGATRWLVGAGRFVVDTDGQTERMVGVNYDVTERKKFQAELERLVAERTVKLQELVTEMEHLSYALVHDMRAPLRSMAGFAEMAAELCASPDLQEQRRLLQRISHSTARMDSLVTDALNYSEAVGKYIPLSTVDVNRLLRGMIDSYPEFQPSRTHIRIEGEIPLVVANEAGLTQCFSNLLSNAIKFVQPGKFPEIRIWAELRRRLPELIPDLTSSPKPFNAAGFAPIASLPPPIQQAGPTCWVRIWVEDNGIGISESMLPRVFNMFARGGSGHVGNGIGLAIVRKVADRMSGRAGVESVEGKGSRFWLELLADGA